MTPENRTRLWLDVADAIANTRQVPTRRRRPSVWRLGVLAAIASLSVVGFALVVISCSERYPR